MDLAAITASYEGLKIGKSLLKALYETKIEADAKEKVDEVLLKLGEAQDILFSMREELFRLQSENEQLKRSIAASEEWANKLSEYELSETEGGAVVYRYLGAPEHFACPSCIVKKEIQILQNNRTPSGKYRCVSCEAEYPINPKAPPPSPMTIRRAL